LQNEHGYTLRVHRNDQAGRHRRSPVVTIAGVAGEVVLTAGVLVLLYVVYVLWGTGIHAERAQDELRAETLDAWANQGGSDDEDPDPEDDVPLVELGELDIGDGYGFLRIPRFGDNWEWVVVEGTELSDLSRGPGHYRDTADVGELGNFSIAGHRSGYGQPFIDMDKIRAGDTVEIETSDGTWTYTIDQEPVVVKPTDTWVVDPVPDADQAEPNERRITLTTCHPRYGSDKRMYVSGVLTSGEEV
jgi:LPXTG-site transpeptidase (sortase) family protein